MPKISPHAVIDPKARLAEDVEVGPFCVIGPDVTIGPTCRLVSSVTVHGHTTLGSDNVLYPYCVVGGTPQDKKYRGAPTRLEIGNGNAIREGVTINCGTEKGGGITRVGDGNMLMINVHVGHDGQIGNHCILANNVMVGGHVICGNNVSIMGGAGIHHFVTIGDFAYIGALSHIHHDVLPYCKVDGSDEIRGLNSIGLQRAGWPPQDIDALEEACRRLFYSDQPIAVAVAEFNTQNGLNPRVKSLLEFLRRRGESPRGRYLETHRPK